MRHYGDSYLSLRPAFLPAACLRMMALPQSPEKFAGSPTGGHMDVLSEVLKVVKLQGAMFYNGEFSSPWSFCSPPSRTVAPYERVANKNSTERDRKSTRLNSSHTVISYAV